MNDKTPTGIPIRDCATCGRRHPITRRHCAGCGLAHLFPIQIQSIRPERGAE